LQKYKSVESIEFKKFIINRIVSAGASFRFKTKLSSVKLPLKKNIYKRCSVDPTDQRTTDFSTYNGSCAQLWNQVPITAEIKELHTAC
jgi:hypothetical protein